MKKILMLFILFSKLAMSQPSIDIVNFNYQNFSSVYKQNNALKNNTNDFNFNLFFPKEFKNGNVFIFRFNSEFLKSSSENNTSSISSFALPVGFQFISKNKKWKTIALVIPKIASDFENKFSSADFQLGSYFLENYAIKEDLKFKIGLYYNKECFGNFFVPLIGIDWKVNKRLNFFGVLPTNYKIEYNVIKSKLYSGLNFKSLTRSFNISSQNNYVRFDEMLIKAFAEYNICKNIIVYSEIGYSLGKNPLLYNSSSKNIETTNTVYSLTKNYMIFNFGIAYRIRKD